MMTTPQGMFHWVQILRSSRAQILYTWKGLTYCETSTRADDCPSLIGHIMFDNATRASYSLRMHHRPNTKKLFPFSLTFTDITWIKRMSYRPLESSGPSSYVLVTGSPSESCCSTFGLTPKELRYLQVHRLFTISFQMTKVYPEK